MCVETLWASAWEFARVCACWGRMEGRVDVGRGHCRHRDSLRHATPLIHNSQRPSKHESTPLYSQTHMHISKHTYGMRTTRPCNFNVIICRETSNRLTWNWVRVSQSAAEQDFPFLVVSMKATQCVTPVRPHCNSDTAAAAQSSTGLCIKHSTAPAEPIASSLQPYFRRRCIHRQYLL